jgi:uncharacterized protein (DUF433 family)
MDNTALREKIKEVFKLGNVAILDTLMPKLPKEFRVTEGQTSKEKFNILVNVVEKDDIIKLINDNIEKNKSIRFGKPVIKGTRISVYDVVDLVVENYSTREIMEQYPTIDNENQIRAALLYYFNKHIRRDIRFRIYLWTAR